MSLVFNFQPKGLSVSSFSLWFFETFDRVWLDLEVSWSQAWEGLFFSTLAILTKGRKGQGNGNKNVILSFCR